MSTMRRMKHPRPIRPYLTPSVTLMGFVTVLLNLEMPWSVATALCGKSKRLHCKQRSHSGGENKTKTTIGWNNWNSVSPPPMPTPPADDPLPPVFSVQIHEVLKLLRQQNTRNAPGPDVSPATLKHWHAEQLAPVLKDIFNLSIQMHTVPVCLKKSVTPVPKIAQVCTPNEYWPVALTSVVMKVFERLVLLSILSLQPTMCWTHCSLPTAWLYTVFCNT